MAALTDAEVAALVRDEASICRPCAEEHGAVWDNGHAATHWLGRCGFCGVEKAVCCVTDWNWPRLSSKTQKIVRGNREF